MLNLVDRYEQAGKVCKLSCGCWLWLGATTGKGYGSLSRGRYVHRVFYETLKEAIPEGMQLRHSCDVKSGVNPEHLSVGTHSDNVFDAVLRDRYFGTNQNAIKTHCHRGHEFTPDTVYLYKGHRHCKLCWKLKYKNN